MKQMTKISLVVMSLAFLSTGIAQQTRQSNVYNYNKFGLNPAYAGASGCTEVNFSHLNQWVKVDGAPSTSFFNANTRLGKSWGVGANLMIDRLGMMNQFSVSGAASYGFAIAREHNLRLGISGGYFQMRLDPTSAIAFDQGDVILDGGEQTSNSFNSEAGILYQFKGLELSVGTQQLIETRTNSTYQNLDGFGLKRHYNGYVSYDIPINKKVSLKPNVRYHGIDIAQQFDLNLDANYNDFLYGGLGYRTQAGIVARVGVSIRKLFFIGYSYETPMQNLASYSAGSHEVVLGLKFCKSDPKEVADNLPPTPDTIRIVEQITDTLIVERIDTIYIEPVAVDELKRAMFDASENLEFKYDQAIIEKQSYASLEALTNMLLIRENTKILLEGHTDSDGTEAYNMRLSKNRVEAVKRFLVSNGVDASRVKTAHYGESKPIASNDTEEGKARNRRVEMKIISE